MRARCAIADHNCHRILTLSRSDLAPSWEFQKCATAGQLESGLISTLTLIVRLHILALYGLFLLTRLIRGWSTKSRFSS